MRNARVLLIAASAVVWCSASFADAPVPDVDALFAQLSSTDAKVREAASSELIEHADKVIARLEELVDAAHEPQARAAGATLVKTIRDGSTTLPSVITLDVKDAPPREVFESIARQAGVRLMPSDDDPWEKLGDKTVTLSVKRQSFWSVMKELLPQLGLAVRNDMPPRRLVLLRARSDAMAGPTYMTGPFMVVATRVKESREIKFDPAAEKMPAETNISITFHAEPKLPLLGRDYNATIEEFVDDAGHSLKSDREYLRPFETQRSSGAFGIIVPVSDVEGRTKRVAKLKGYLRVYVQTRGDVIEIRDVLNSAGASEFKAGSKLSVDAVRGTHLRLSGQLAVGAERRDMKTWLPGFSRSSLRIIDAADREVPLRQAGGGTTGGRQWLYECSIEVIAPPATPPLKLVWEFPLEWREIRIPFEFTDLPLP